jgi:hypothetical protein
MKAKLPTQTSFVPRISNTDSMAAFVKSLPKSKDGANSYVTDFCFGAHAMLTRETVSLSDLLVTLKFKDIPVNEVARLFELWAKKMAALGVIREVPSVYDEKIFQVL